MHTMMSLSLWIFQGGECTWYSWIKIWTKFKKKKRNSFWNIFKNIFSHSILNNIWGDLHSSEWNMCWLTVWWIGDIDLSAFCRGNLTMGHLHMIYMAGANVPIGNYHLPGWKLVDHKWSCSKLDKYSVIHLRLLTECTWQFAAFPSL